jgi:NNP family nitrate/nitrite transporter-like MFS transporter
MPQAAGTAPPPPAKGSVGKVAKSLNMWKVMFCSGFSVGCALLVNTYLTQALILERGLDPINAGYVSTLLNVCLIIGGVISGFVVSKSRRINIPYAFICIVGGIGYFVVWSVPFGPVTYVLIALTGIIVSGSIGVNFTRIPLLPLTGDFGVENIATAAGMNNTALGIMAFLIPTVVAAIAKDNFGLVFIIATVIFVIIGLVGMTIPELGESGALAKGARGSNA